MGSICTVAAVTNAEQALELTPRQGGWWPCIECCSHSSQSHLFLHRVGNESCTAQTCPGFGVLMTSSELEMWSWGCGDGMEKEGVGPLGTAGDAEGANIPTVVSLGMRRILPHQCIQFADLVPSVSSPKFRFSKKHHLHLSWLRNATAQLPRETSPGHLRNARGTQSGFGSCR